MQMETRKTKELKMHQTSLDIYGKSEDVSDLVESIRLNGLLVPLTVKPDGTILSGNRRYRAAKELGLEEVPCVTAEPKTPEEEEIFIIEANRNRKKDVYQLYNEGVRLKAAYAVQAKKRQATKANNSSSDGGNGSCMVPANLAVSKTGNPKGYEKGQTSAVIADALGMKERSWQRLQFIANLAETGNETAIELLARIDKEDLSISKAEKILKQSLKAPSVRGEPEEEKSLFLICTEQSEKNSRNLIKSLNELNGIPDEEFRAFVCYSLCEDLKSLTRSMQKFEEKLNAHRTRMFASAVKDDRDKKQQGA